MAFLIPENVRTDKGVPVAHRRVASALAFGLDDSATVWYEPPLDRSGERPHFVVVEPSLGVVVVQVIEQVEDRADEVLGAWQRVIRVARGSREVEVPDPLAMARRFADTLAESFRGVPELSMVSVGAVAALPYLTRVEAEDRGLDTVFDLDAALTKETISEATGSDTVLPRIFARVLGGVPDELLSGEAISLIRAAVHPDLVIGTPPEPVVVGDDALFDVGRIESGDAMKVMDREQERMARGLGTGHRVIRGVAGSGKTLILIHRARFIAGLLPDRKVLVTCYTKALASHLESELSDLPNVEVRNLDRLMMEAARGAGLPTPRGSEGWDELPSTALQALERRHPGRFRAVLVDEAQDFSTDALRFCVGLVEREGESEGDLVVVADSAQNIFRRNFRWKDAGINAAGRTKILRVNYRNTKEILDFAHRFLTAGSAGSDEEPDVDDETAIIPPESAERTGMEPAVVQVDGVRGEVAAVLEQVRRWWSPGLRPRSIAVLLTRSYADGRAESIVTGLRESGIPVFWTHEGSGSKEEVGAAEEAVIVSTVHSAKGLEFPRVVVADLGSQVRDDSRKLLYVAFTRAVDELTVVVDRTSPFGGDLRVSAST